MKAVLNQYRQSPRKIRLVADLSRGKQVDQAIYEIKFSNKRVAPTLVKLIESAIANAIENHDGKRIDLYIKSIRVDGGAVLKRSMPRARGSASRIKKRTSHIVLELESKK